MAVPMLLWEIHTAYFSAPALFIPNFGAEIRLPTVAAQFKKLANILVEINAVIW